MHHIIAKSFWLPKHGNTPAEYEDAFCPKNNNQTVDTLFRAAIADGATEASFSKQWANLLVQAYCRAKLNDDKKLIQHLPLLQKQWFAQITQKPLPWYAQEKLRRGAFSTLLGFTLHKNHYEAIAMGDSCLFHISGDKLENCLPLESSKQFNNCPPLLSSSVAYNESIAKHLICNKYNNWKSGDEFYLMTDALACWFLQAYEKKRKPWVKMRCLRQSQFVKWIAELRNTKALHNDDVTLLRIITK